MKLMRHLQQKTHPEQYNTVRGVDMLRTVPPEALTHLYQILPTKWYHPRTCTEALTNAPSL